MVTNYTNSQLKQALAKMLPDHLDFWDRPDRCGLEWHDVEEQVLDTELLHICWMVESDFDYEDWTLYITFLGEIVRMNQSLKWITPCNYVSATWQQRVVALSKVKNIEI